MNPDSDDILKAARRLLNTPFHHQGRVPLVGIDCVGVLVSVAKDLELPHVDFTGYARVPRKSVLSKYLKESGCERISIDAAGVGDILTFWFQIEDLENHAAILSHNGQHETIIHAYAEAGFVIEHDFTDYWRERVMSAWRFPSRETA